MKPLWRLQAALQLAALSQVGARAGLKVRRLARARLQFRPRPDDIFICSYPKSGTTLLQMILFQLTTDGDVERIPHILAVSPWFEAEPWLDLRDYLAAFPSPRILKSHLHRRGLPRAGKLIYVVRDVRDVALSAYHHSALVSGREIQLDPFMDQFLRGHPMFGGGTWASHVRSWWPHRNDPNVLFLRYDEMLADLAGTVRRVAAFCGLPVPEAEMPRILERCGIAYMKAHGDKFDPRLHRTSASDWFFDGAAPGVGRRDLSPRQQALVTSPVAALARELGAKRDEPGAKLLYPSVEPAMGTDTGPESGSNRGASPPGLSGAARRPRWRPAAASVPWRLVRARQDLLLATRFKPRPDDVFLVSFPRSGLTLLQMALYQLTTGGEMSFGHIAEVSPTLETDLLQLGAPQILALPSPRVFRSHLTYDRLPRGGRVVYLARDIRDVAAAAYRLSAQIEERGLDLDAFLREFVKGHPGFGGTWCEHLRSWWPHRNDPNVLFLDYDDLVTDPTAALRRVAAHCGLALDEADLPRIVERCSLDFLRAHAARFDPRLRHLSGPLGSFIRKGQPGGGKLQLSARHKEALERQVRELARDLGITPGQPHTEIFALE